jgi:hypothetical protein
MPGSELSAASLELQEIRSRRSIGRNGGPIALKQPIGDARRALGTGPVAKILQLLGKNPPAAEVQDTLHAYATMPWLRAISDKIGAAITSVKWRAYVRVEKGAKGHRRIVRDVHLQRATGEQRKNLIRELLETGELVEISDHPLITALYNEGSHFTGITLRELTQKYLDLVGEAFWIKIRNSDGMPIQFMPVPPHWVKETPRTDANYFEINPPTSVTGRYEKKIDPEDMIWFVHPDPYNPYLRGVGMGSTLADELETDEYAAKFLKNFFYNQARPDYLIFGEGLSREDTERLERRWLDKLRGMFRGFAPFFLNRKLEIQRLTQDYGHLQMLDLRSSQRDTCLQVFGAQPEIFGITVASNRATSEVAEYLFSRWVIVPRCEFMQAVLQVNLVPEYDERIILDYDSPIMQDKEHKLKVAMAAPWSITLDEWRDLGGWRPLPMKKGELVFCKPLNFEFFNIDDAKNPEPPEDDEPENETPPETDQSEDDDGDEPDDEQPPDEDEAERLAEEVHRMGGKVAVAFSNWIESVRGNAFAKLPDLVAMLDDDDTDGFMGALLDALGVHDDLNRETQKLVVLAGMMTAGQIKPYCADDAQIESYGIGAHSYCKNGTPLIHDFIDEAMAGADEAVALMKASGECSNESLAKAVAAGLGFTEEHWRQWFSSDDGAAAIDEATAHLEHEVPQRIAADAVSMAQWHVLNDAVKAGHISTKRIARRWIRHPQDEECRQMAGAVAKGLEYWDLDSGDTVIVPTRSRPDCRCFSKLVINGGEK